MTMPWFKFYPEARTDRKLRSLSRDQRLVWLDLLCYAAEQSDRGIIRFDDDDLLALEVADGDVALMNETLGKLQSLRIISVCPDNETVKRVSGVSPVSSRFIAFLAFDKRQGGVSCNAKTSTERVRKCRENKRLRHDETMKRDETPVKRDETTDRDREEEGEKRNTPLAPRGEASKPTRDSREPISIEAEPFDSGQTDPLPESVTPPKPAVVNDPAEVARLVLKAESIFRGNFDVGMSVREASRKIKADWIDEALDIAQEKKAQSWGFVRSVFARFKAQGMSDSEKQASEWEKKQKTSLWNQPSHVPEPDPRRPKNMRSVNALSESEILEFRTRGVA